MGDVKKSVPGLVKAISILYYVFMGLYVLFAILIFIGGGFVSLTLPIIGALGTLSFIFQGIFALIFAVFLYYIANGLWRGNNNARIATIIFLGLGIIKGILDYFAFNVDKTLFNFIFNLVLGLAISSYLLFNKRVKNAFLG
jgi:hypothetical protein